MSQEGEGRMNRFVRRSALAGVALLVAACMETAPTPPPQAETPAPETAERTAPEAVAQQAAKGGGHSPYSMIQDSSVLLTQSYVLLSGEDEAAGDEPADEIEADDPVAQADPADLYEDGGDLAERTRTALAKARLPADQVGFMVVDQETGTILAEHNADAGFIPASVAKVPSTLTALDVLGGDHRFRTVMAIDGTVEDGTLDGDVYLWGGGDPMLEPIDLTAFVRALGERGIERVAGRFVYDDSYLVTAEAIDPNQPDDAGYNPSIGALSLAFNRVRLEWSPAKGGGFVAKAVAHSNELAVPVRSVSLTAAGSNASRYMRFEHASGAEGEEAWLVGPSQRRGGTRWLPVRYPGRNTAGVLRAIAADAGIELPEPEAGRVPQQAQAIHRHESRTLSEILPRVLKYSNNMATELIGLVATRQMVGEARTLRGSGDATAEWLRSKMPLTDWEGFLLDNHSGLSSDSRMSPRQMMAVLDYAFARPHGGVAYGTMLPKKWKTAWAKEHAGIPDDAAIRAKSGTMYYGRGLAGVIETPDGRRLLFTFFASDLAARNAYDADPDRLAPWNTRKARGWLKQAKTLEQQLVALWSSAPVTLQVRQPDDRPVPVPARNKAEAVPAEVAAN